MQSAIIIPARYGSTRFPGKPLAVISGKPLLQWVIEVAQKAAEQVDNTAVYIATDDDRIANQDWSVPCLMTSENCLNGTDRVYQALLTLPENNQPSIVLNLQGDAPLTEPDHLVALLNCLKSDESIEMATPAHRLSWEALDLLRENKRSTPFSGTTVVMDQNSNALWFSKNILPAIRKEDRSASYSPVYQHIGLYGYRTSFLKQYITWPESPYEKLEGLEQLRVLENGYKIRIVPVRASQMQIGIDSPQDAKRAEAFLLAKK